MRLTLQHSSNALCNEFRVEKKIYIHLFTNSTYGKILYYGKKEDGKSLNNFNEEIREEWLGGERSVDGLRIGRASTMSQW